MRCGAVPAAALMLALAAAPAHAQKTHVVVIEGMVFVPSTLTVRRGDKVVWRNRDLVPHTATAAGRFDTGNIAAGKSRTRVVKLSGRHDYVCTYHPGMKASVVVQ